MSNKNTSQSREMFVKNHTANSSLSDLQYGHIQYTDVRMYVCTVHIITPHTSA